MQSKEAEILINMLRPNVIKKLKPMSHKRSSSFDQRQFNKKILKKEQEKKEFEVDLDNMTYEEILALEEKIGNVGKGEIRNLEFIPDVFYSISFSEPQ